MCSRASGPLSGDFPWLDLCPGFSVQVTSSRKTLLGHTSVLLLPLYTQCLVFSSSKHLAWSAINALFFKIILFIYLLLAVLGLHCCVGSSIVAVASGDYSSVVVLRFPIPGASLVVEHGL